MFVIKIDGRQCFVKQGSLLTVNKIDKEINETVELNYIAKIQDNKVVMENGLLKVEIIKHQKSKKLIAFKKKRRKGYSRKKGSRSEQTVVKFI